VADGGNQTIVEVGGGVSVTGVGVDVASQASMAEHEERSPVRKAESKNRFKVTGIL